jgi:hypothetical protein
MRELTEEDFAILRQMMAQENLRDTRNKERVRKFLLNLTEDQIDLWMHRILTWEEKFEEYQYTQHHTQTEHFLFGVIIDVIREYSTPLRIRNEDMFLSENFRWRNYTFKSYSGQGSFWRILKNKKRIFQQK